MIAACYKTGWQQIDYLWHNRYDTKHIYWNLHLLWNMLQPEKVKKVVAQTIVISDGNHQRDAQSLSVYIIKFTKHHD
jgi:hypothetical protein